MTDPAVSVVVLAYGEEPLLGACLRGILGSIDVQVEIILVDNGCTSGSVAEASSWADPRIVLLTPGRNTGFTGGCNLAAQHAVNPTLVLVNSDAVVEPEALSYLARRAATSGLATASVRLRDSPGRINSIGNPVHFTGLSWAGGFGESAEHFVTPQAVASASGCAMAVRREIWDHLGGFNEEMFAYGEDMELSLRCWLGGWTVEFEPMAVVLHQYDFHRNPQKFYLLERNRLLTLLTVYRVRTLVLLSPVLLGLELAVAAHAARDGWLRDKVAGWTWILRHPRVIRRRRRFVQSRRTRSDRVLAEIFTGSFAPGDIPDAPRATRLSALSALYWRLVRGLIR